MGLEEGCIKYVDTIQKYVGFPIDLSPFRRTFELGEFITTAGKIQQNCEVWLQNTIKCGKYSHLNFENFVYFCITHGEVYDCISKRLRYFVTKLHSFTKLMMLFSTVLMSSNEISYLIQKFVLKG